MSNRIKQLRDEKRMTQVRLSVELEVAQETISSYENGSYFPSYANLLKMTSIFDASIDYIMGLSDIRNPVKEGCIEQDEAKALSLYRKMKPAEKQKAIAFMQGLLA